MDIDGIGPETIDSFLKINLLLRFQIYRPKKRRFITI